MDSAVAMLDLMSFFVQMVKSILKAVQGLGNCTTLAVWRPKSKRNAKRLQRSRWRHAGACA